MSKKLLQDHKAEDEANRIASRFMDSNDVVGDMSRSLGHDFSSVRIHTDQAAAQRVEGTGADAFASGKDIFFGRGVFQPNDRASRGLLAHELTHTMQQSGGGGEVQAQAPEGAMQGGIIDWFRRRFTKISQPTPARKPDTPFSVKMGEDISAPMRNFMSSGSYALHEMLQHATPEQLRSPQLQQMVLQDYNTSMNARLRSSPKDSKVNMDSNAFRGSAGELKSLSMVAQALMPEDFGSQVAAAHESQGSDAAMDYISQMVEGNEPLMNLMAGTDASFDGVQYYDSPSARSAITMNNLVLRLVSNSIQDVNKSKELQKAVNTGTSDSAVRLRELLTRRFQYR